MRRSHVLAATLVIAAAATAGAQSYEKPKPRAGHTGGGRATPAQAEQPREREAQHDRPRERDRGHEGNGGGSSVPVQVTNDGRIYADFGYGWEQVVRSCAAQENGTRTTVPATPNAQGLQPVPDQKTESARMLPSAQAAEARSQQQQAQERRARSCYVRDGYGRVWVR